MITIHWKPTPAQLRRWALLMALVLGVIGSLFHFVNWGVFAKGHEFALILWGFGAFVLFTAGTGTKIGLPAYWLCMGFAFVMATVIGVISLAAVFFLVVTPLAIGARIFGRDRLQIYRAGEKSMWRSLPTTAHDPQRQF